MLYDGFMQIQKIIFDHALFQGGVQKAVHRELVIRGHAVGVLLFDPTLQEFVLVEQVRIGALKDSDSPWLLEIVAGMVEKGESVKDVAIRESFEEAKAEVKKLIPIQEYWVSPGGSDEKVSLFLAEIDSSKVGRFAGLESEHEDIKVVRLSVNDALKKLQLGQINNAMTIIAFQWFFLNYKQDDFAF